MDCGQEWCTEVARCVDHNWGGSGICFVRHVWKCAWFGSWQCHSHNCAAFLCWNHSHMFGWVVAEGLWPWLWHFTFHCHQYPVSFKRAHLHKGSIVHLDWNSDNNNVYVVLTNQMLFWQWEHHLEGFQPDHHQQWARSRIWGCYHCPFSSSNYKDWQDSSIERGILPTKPAKCDQPVGHCAGVFDCYLLSRLSSGSSYSIKKCSWATWIIPYQAVLYLQHAYYPSECSRHQPLLHLTGS